MKLVALFLLLLGTGACTTATGPAPFVADRDPVLLPGGTWSLVQAAAAGGDVSTPRARLTARFTADGRVGGRAGPNHYGGEYTAGGAGEIALAGLVTTLIGGPEAEEAGEYLERMSRARSFEVTPGELRLHLPDGGWLHFRREADTAG
ncbi:MAG TPA: META domain-containing protein [Longimicrobiaceae bacterium]|nr:META domain-containing protein [Longimicrobiaceae bacterium]